MIYLFSGPSKTSRAKMPSGINPPTLLAYADLIIE
jgi:hypothetical protein